MWHGGFLKPRYEKKKRKKKVNFDRESVKQL